MSKFVLALSILGFSVLSAFAAQTTTGSEVLKQAVTKTDANMQQVVDKLAGVPGKMTETSLGSILTTASGHTLYIFDKDSNGVSNCDALCLKNWPAFHAAKKIKAVAPWSKVKASDGKEMWAYDGKPVYTYIKDKKAGDTEGDGVGGNWHIVN